MIIKYPVYISAKPTVTVTPSRITVDEDENVTLSCTSTGGRPPGHVTWTKNRKKIGDTKQRENILFLRNVNAEDAGNYVCTAESYPDDKFRDVKSVELTVNCKYLKINMTSYTSFNFLILEMSLQKYLKNGLRRQN